MTITRKRTTTRKRTMTKKRSTTKKRKTRKRRTTEIEIIYLIHDKFKVEVSKEAEDRRDAKTQSSKETLQYPTRYPDLESHKMFNGTGTPQKAPASGKIRRLRRTPAPTLQHWLSLFGYRYPYHEV